MDASQEGEDVVGFGERVCDVWILRPIAEAIITLAIECAGLSENDPRHRFTVREKRGAEGGIAKLTKRFDAEGAALLADELVTQANDENELVKLC